MRGRLSVPLSEEGVVFKFLGLGGRNEEIARVRAVSMTDRVHIDIRVNVHIFLARLRGGHDLRLVFVRPI